MLAWNLRMEEKCDISPEGFFFQLTHDGMKQQQRL